MDTDEEDTPLETIPDILQDMDGEVVDSDDSDDSYDNSDNNDNDDDDDDDDDSSDED